MAWKIDQDGVAYFITSTVVDWLPVFDDPHAVTILYRWLNHAHRHGHMRIAAYVVMPTHLHLIVFDEDFVAARLRAAVSGWRTQTGALLTEFVDAHGDERSRDAMRLATTEHREHRFRQSGVRPEAIASAHWLHQKVEYIHDNPVRKGLVRVATDWPDSSAGFYRSGEIGPVPVTPLEL